MRAQAHNKKQSDSHIISYKGINYFELPFRISDKFGENIKFLKCQTSKECQKFLCKTFIRKTQFLTECFHKKILIWRIFLVWVPIINFLKEIFFRHSLSWRWRVSPCSRKPPSAPPCGGPLNQWWKRIASESHNCRRFLLGVRAFSTCASGIAAVSRTGWTGNEEQAHLFSCTSSVAMSGTVAAEYSWCVVASTTIMDTLDYFRLKDF